MRMNSFHLFKHKNFKIMIKWKVACTCGRARNDMKSFYYLVEEYKKEFRSNFGKYDIRVINTYKYDKSTIVCMNPGCRGRARVLYDPKQRGMKPILQYDYNVAKGLNQTAPSSEKLEEDRPQEAQSSKPSSKQSQN